MKIFLVYPIVLVGCLGLIVVGGKSLKAKPCWCWSRDQYMVAGPKAQVERNEYVTFGSYGSEPDWNNPDRILPLDYSQEQGKRVFYQQCVWCHADATPAGPSNRSNVTPEPPLLNDGAALNGESDALLKKIIERGGSGVGKSAMMPPYGSTLSQEEISDLIAFMRVIAIPEYHQRPGKSNSGGRSKPS